MRIFKLTPQNHPQAIARAIKILSSDGLIIYPTETCYGLGVDATNPDAVQKLLTFKTRREGKAISIAVASQSMAQKYVTLNSTALNLYRHFLPGPLTIVSRLKRLSSSRARRGIWLKPLKEASRPDSSVHPDDHRGSVGMTSDTSIAPGLASPKPLVEAGLASEKHTLGVRIPDYPFVLKLITQFNRPITATSANVSYKPAPYSLTQWRKSTPQKSQKLVDLFLDAGRLPRRPPSTVIDTTTDELTVLRQGTIKISQPSAIITTNSEAETKTLAAKTITNYQDAIHQTGLIIALQGELGAGKTVFAQGVARALGIKDQIKSPTFTLIHEYRIPKLFFTERSRSAVRSSLPRTSIPLSGLHSVKKHPTFYHIDTWRLEKPQELLNLGFERMLKPGNLILIEWAEKVFPIVKKLCQQHHFPLIISTIDVLNPATRRWNLSNA